VPDSQDLTRELSNIDEGHSSDPSYESLEMTRAEYMKRQKCSGEGFTSFGTHKTPQLAKDSMPLTRNISFGGQLPALSEGRPGHLEE
jgi:hypothetical protein